jgi:hypothetical protein
VACAIAAPSQPLKKQLLTKPSRSGATTRTQISGPQVVALVRTYLQAWLATGKGEGRHQHPMRSTNPSSSSPTASTATSASVPRNRSECPRPRLQTPRRAPGPRVYS